MWRNYLLGNIFDVKMDHGDLKYLFGYPTLNSKQIRLLEFLAEYKFKIKHIKGNKN